MTMKLKIVSLIILSGILTFKSFGQEPTIEFEFDREIALKYAILSFEEYEKHNPNYNHDFKNNYDTKNPFFSSLYSFDCDNKKIYIVIVIFKDNQGKGSACVIQEYNKDNYFKSTLRRSFTSQNIDEILEEIKNAQENDFWGCHI